MILKIRDELLGGHVHVAIFVGTDADHLALAGTLVFRTDEWGPVQLLLAMGAVHDTTGCTVIGDDAFNAAVEAAVAKLGL